MCDGEFNHATTPTPKVECRADEVSSVIRVVPIPTGESKASLGEPRVVGAWCAWLDSMATDAEAAMAAALAYQQLDDAARDNWLDVVQADLRRVVAPRIAVFAPLLAVEVEPGRRQRILAAIGPMDAASLPRSEPRGLLGFGEDGVRIGVLVVPLYLDFVQVLACRYHLSRGFDWVRHDPIVDLTKCPVVGDGFDAIVLERVSFQSVVDEFAQSIVAHVRGGRPVPTGLSCFAYLFSASGEPYLGLPAVG